MPIVVGSGYQHSLSEVRAKVRNRLMQTTASNSNWTDGMLNDYINDALKHMLLKGLVEIAQDQEVPVRVTEPDREVDTMPPHDCHLDDSLGPVVVGDLV